MSINVILLRYRVCFGNINDDNTLRFVSFKCCITRVIMKELLPSSVSARPPTVTTHPVYVPPPASLTSRQ